MNIFICDGVSPQRCNQRRNAERVQFSNYQNTFSVFSVGEMDYWQHQRGVILLSGDQMKNILFGIFSSIMFPMATLSHAESLPSASSEKSCRWWRHFSPHAQFLKIFHFPLFCAQTLRILVRAPGVMDSSLRRSSCWRTLSHVWWLGCVQWVCLCHVVRVESTFLLPMRHVFSFRLCFCKHLILVFNKIQFFCFFFKFFSFSVFVRLFVHRGGIGCV